MQKSKKHGINIVSILLYGVLVSLGAKAHLIDFSKLVEENSPSVVNISILKYQRRDDARQNLPQQYRNMPEDWLRFFFDAPQGDRKESNPDGRRRLNSLGSGFIIDSDGYIVTNHHVIKEADEIVVRLNDLREMKAELVGSDKRTDIALLKIDAKNLRAVRFGNSEKLKVGEWVIAIGSPFGFDYSVTSGIVSAKRRSLPNDSYVPFIQTDAAVNPGNSGGPLFNLSGEVIGINSQIYSGSGGFQGLSFAIPVDLVMHIVQQLKEKGAVTRGYLGVHIQEVTSELSESFDLDKPHGALVVEILPDSAADKGGLKVGDVITHFNGRRVNQSYELPPMVGIAPVGEEATINIIRKGETIQLHPVIGLLPDEAQKAQNGHSQSGRSIEGLGVYVSVLPDSFKEHIQTGLFVKRVRANSPAHYAGIRSGDVLLRVRGEDMTRVSDLEEVMQQLERGVRVPALVWRDGRTRFISIVLP